jgi:hypothetical protein
MNLRKLAVVASLLMGSAAFAAQQAALPSGQPAGMKQAQSFGSRHQLLWVVGGALVVGGIVMVATGNGHGRVPTCQIAGCTNPTPTTTTGR